MRNKKTRPAVRGAFDFVRHHLEQGTWRSGDLLPPTRHLARVAGVSPVTMIKAVALLKSEGYINGVERGRLRAGSDPFLSGKMPTAAADHSIWRMKRAALEKDLLSGAFAAQGRLPSYKELQARYGTCFQTMRKILHSMAADKVVRLIGKSFVLEQGGRRFSPERIVYITHSVAAAPRSALNQEQFRVIDVLERECIHRGLRLDTVEIDFYNTLETRRAASGAAIVGPCMGYILDVWWFTSEEFRRSYLDLLGRLALLKQPVAILDELDDFVLPVRFTANPLIQVFRIEGRSAGGRMARLLLGMGHRSVAYISSMHLGQWSRHRFEGVKDQFEKAGLGDRVHACITDKMDVPLLHILSLSGFDEKLIQRIVSVGRTPTQAEDQYQSYLRHREGAPRHYFGRREEEHIRENLACIQDADRRNLANDFFGPLCVAAIKAAASRVSALFLEPLFAQALRATDVTAWICATDGMAIAAISFLNDRAIDVPEKISVSGFDNVPVSALESHLTSFDFNMNGFVHRMLNYIARPPRPRGAYRHSVIEVEGMVIERTTTAPPGLPIKPPGI